MESIDDIVGECNADIDKLNRKKGFKIEEGIKSYLEVVYRAAEKRNILSKGSLVIWSYLGQKKFDIQRQKFFGKLNRASLAEEGSKYEDTTLEILKLFNQYNQSRNPVAINEGRKYAAYVLDKMGYEQAAEFINSHKKRIRALLQLRNSSTDGMMNELNLFPERFQVERYLPLCKGHSRRSSKDYGHMPRSVYRVGPKVAI